MFLSGFGLLCCCDCFCVVQELLKLIELDIVAIDVLDLTPQSEYEVYMKSYGRANTAQVCGQELYWRDASLSIH